MEAHPGGPAQDCQRCSEGKQATHRCEECAQVLCADCTQAHAPEEPGQYHTLLPLQSPSSPPTPAPGGDGGGGEVRERRGGGGEKDCPKHASQKLVLFCSQCQTTLCIVCKLTSHPDHPIEDLMDTGKRARAELTQELQTLTQREELLRAVLAKAQDFQEDLHHEKQSLEDRMGDRANELRQMVERAQAEALESVAATTEKALRELKEQTVPVEERYAITQAKVRRMSQVISEAEDSKAVALLAEVKEEKSKSDTSRNVLRVERGTVKYGYRIRAVKYTNVLAFIGGASEGPLMEARASGLGPESLEVSTRAEAHPSSLALGFGKKMSRGRSAPVETHYSKNPNSTLAALHVMSTDDDIWVNFNPGGSVALFGMFDDDGYMREVHSEDIPSSTVLLTCDGDTVVSVTNGCWVRAGNESGLLDNFTAWGCTAVSKSITVHLLKDTSIFRLKSNGLPPVIEDTPTYTCEGFGASFDVSNDGKFVASTVGNAVKVFDKLKASPALRSYADYVVTDSSPPSDVCFCIMDGKEVMLVAYVALNSVHVVNHKDGCCFIRTLDSEKYPLTAPCRLTTNHHGRVWVGCNGGKVVIFDV